MMRDRFCHFLLFDQHLFLALGASVDWCRWRTRRSFTATRWRPDWRVWQSRPWRLRSPPRCEGRRSAGPSPPQSPRCCLRCEPVPPQEQCFNGVVQTGCIHTASSGREELKAKANGTGGKKCQWNKGKNWNIYQKEQNAIFMRKGCTREKKKQWGIITLVSFISQKLHKQRPILYQFSTFFRLNTQKIIP